MELVSHDSRNVLMSFIHDPASGEWSPVRGVPQLDLIGPFQEARGQTHLGFMFIEVSYLVIWKETLHGSLKISSRPNDMYGHPIAQGIQVLKGQVRGAWVAQSVRRPTSAQVMISQSVSSSPTSGSVLITRSLLLILCLPLSLPLPCLRCLKNE